MESKKMENSEVTAVENNEPENRGGRGCLSSLFWFAVGVALLQLLFSLTANH
jgi:hypothetical protein